MKITKLIDYWKINDRNYYLKQEGELWIFNDYITSLIIINIPLNKKIVLNKINETFKQEEIYNIIINYSLFDLKVKTNEKYI